MIFREVIPVNYGILDYRISTSQVFIQWHCITRPETRMRTSAYPMYARDNDAEVSNSHDLPDLFVLIIPVTLRIGYAHNIMRTLINDSISSSIAT